MEDSPHHKLWENTRSELKDLLNEDTYDRWIAGIIPLSYQDNTLKLGVSNDIFCEWLSTNYKDLIKQKAEQQQGGSVKIEFESGHTPAEEEETETASVNNSKDQKMELDDFEQTAAQSRNQFQSSAPTSMTYNRRFTFDNFVVGENSKFAHAACHAVAKSPGRAYNPLFVHGGTGMGKTHLLQAIAQDVLTAEPRSGVEYLTSEEFANNFINALRDHKLPQFRQRLRNVNILLIDDVHFFTGKTQLQEEFFHTFNSLYNRHKQIVLTSDRPPHEIGGLEKRMVSRFEWGLTTEILVPNFETRLAIVRKKQNDHNVVIDDEILTFLADRIKSNIRRLEGALIRLVSYVSMTGEKITTEKAQEILRPLLEEESTKSLGLEQIQKIVADHYDIRLADMTSKRRPRNIAFPRQVAMYLCRTMTEHSSPAIAESFNRNHATILHATAAVENKMASDLQFRHTIGKLKRKLYA
ncbi:MAG: chromosomal replication initiator protein DnaA, partial [Verrucomicrobiota bacterium]